VQIARAVGARPIGTSRTADKLARLAALGLDPGDAIAVGDKGFAAAIADRTGGRGADVILDSVAPPTSRRTSARWHRAAAWC